jgi:hypothetical protein
MAENFLSSIVENFIFEKIDKQILAKIPYFVLLGFFVSITVFLNEYFTSVLKITIIEFDWPIFDYFFIASFCLMILSFLIFLVFTFRINSLANDAIENVWENLEWEKFTDKISDIFEGQESLRKDVKNILDNDFIREGLVSGIAFLYVFTWIFSYVFIHFKVPIGIQILSFIIVILYIFQEVLKFSPLKDLRSKTNEGSQFAGNLLDLYTIDNSFKESKLTKNSSRILFHILARSIGPVIIINPPDIMVDRIIVYWNPDIYDIIKKYLDPNNDTLDHFIELWKFQFLNPYNTDILNDTEVISRFFEKRDGESIRNFIDQRVVDLFPYLIKGEIQSRIDEINSHPPSDSIVNSKKMPSLAKNHKQIVGFRIQNKEKFSKTVGYIIIHSFKGLPTNPIVLTRPTKNNVLLRTDVSALKNEQVDVFHIFMYGEKNFMSFLKTKFQLNSKAYSMDMLQREPPNSPKIRK